MKLLKTRKDDDEYFNADSIVTISFGDKVKVWLMDGAHFTVSNPESVEELQKLKPEKPAPKAKTPRRKKSNKMEKNPR